MLIVYWRPHMHIYCFKSLQQPCKVGIIKPYQQMKNWDCQSNASQYITEPGYNLKFVYLEYSWFSL